MYISIEAGEIFRRAREYLLAITNGINDDDRDDDKDLPGLEANEFPEGFEPPADFVPPPSRPGFSEIHYNREGVMYK